MICGQGVRADLSPWSNQVEVLLYELVDDGHRRAMRTAKVVEFAEVEQGARKTPTAYLSMDAAQQLIDDLWRCGLRPTEGAGTAGSMAAAHAHLEDMRRIAFGALEKAGVPGVRP